MFEGSNKRLVLWIRERLGELTSVALITPFILIPIWVILAPMVGPDKCTSAIFNERFELLEGAIR